MTATPSELLRVEHLCKFFPVTSGVFGKVVGHVRAVDDVSFTIARGETLGMVGESGCGKTTAGRSLLRLIEPTGGRVLFDGTDVAALDGKELQQYRRRMQIIFQDPFGSLNPRMRVVDIIGEAIERHGLAAGAAVEARVRELLGQVGLSERWIHRYPHEFSGGQRQRIGIARAIAVAPELIVCDEAVSALDVSIQAQVINLLIDLRRDMNLAYLFIAHDLSVVRHISDRVAVMYLGQIVEIAPTAELFERPLHPYTRALLSAIPVPDPRRRRRRLVLQGDVPSPLNPPSGCHFHPRCPAAEDRCSEAPPPVVQLDGGRHQVRCVHAAGLEEARDYHLVLDERINEAMARRARHDDTQPTRLPVIQTPPQQPAPVVATSTPPTSPSSASAPMSPSSASAPMSPSSASAPMRPRIHVTPVFGAVAAALGIALTVLGRFGVGLVLLIAAGAALFASPPRWLRGMSPRSPVFAPLGVCFVLALVASRWVEPARRETRARADLRWLEDEVSAYVRNVGRAPESLAVMRWRTLTRFGLAPPSDPWGRPYRYERGETATEFALSSHGADGVPSEDDVRL